MWVRMTNITLDTYAGLVGQFGDLLSGPATLESYEINK